MLIASLNACIIAHDYAIPHTLYAQKQIAKEQLEGGLP